MAPDFEIRIPGNCLEIAVVVPNRHTISIAIVAMRQSSDCGWLNLFADLGGKYRLLIETNRVESVPKDRQSHKVAAKRITHSLRPALGPCKTGPEVA